VNSLGVIFLLRERSITKGIPMNVIMWITGHTRIEALSKYMDKFTPMNGYRELFEDYFQKD